MYTYVWGLLQVSLLRVRGNFVHKVTFEYYSRRRGAPSGRVHGDTRHTQTLACHDASVPVQEQVAVRECPVYLLVLLRGSAFLECPGVYTMTLRVCF